MKSFKRLKPDVLVDITPDEEDPSKKVISPIMKVISETECVIDEDVYGIEDIKEYPSKKGTIKPTDLRVGNIVLIEGIPRKVEMVTKKKVGYHRGESECRLYYERLNDIQPMLVNGEILISNGWKEVDSDGDGAKSYDYTSDNNDYFLTWWEKGNNENALFNYRKNECAIGTVYEIPVNYIHELQNLINDLKLNIKFDIEKWLQFIHHEG